MEGGGGSDVTLLQKKWLGRVLGCLRIQHAALREGWLGKLFSACTAGSLFTWVFEDTTG